MSVSSRLSHTVNVVIKVLCVCVIQKSPAMLDVTGPNIRNVLICLHIVECNVKSASNEH